MQMQGTDNLDAPPPLPPRSLYVNLHIRDERPDSLQSQQSSSPLQPSSAHGPKRRKKVNGRLLYEGPVQFTFTEYVNENGFLKIYSVGSDGRLARIELFDSNQSPLCLIPFSGVDSVNPVAIQGIRCTVITLQNGKTYRFSASNNKQLFGYCKLLCKLPDDFIPETPKCHLVSQQHMERYNDPFEFGASGIWVVYFINEGIGPTLHLDGLHFVTIQPTNRTFNIYNFYNEEHLLAWNHCDIRRVGRVGTLVFLEVGRRCQGGPGVLWMYCADHLAAEFRESLDKFLHEDAFTEPISIDVYPISTHQNEQQLHFVLDQDQSQNNDNQENFRQRTSAMSIDPQQSLTNHVQTPLHDQNSITTDDHLAKPPLRPPKPIKQVISTPVPVSSFTEGSLMSRELQMTDSVTTEEFAECTSTEHQPPLQVQSSHAPVSDQSLLHPFTVYTAMK